MNNTECKKCKCALNALVIIGVFLIVGWLVRMMIQYTSPAPVGAERAAERRKNLAEQRAMETQVLNNYAWQDQTKGIVRLPINRAMELVQQEWQNPAQGRTELLSRVDKATAVPPKAPEKPSPFE